MSCSGMPFKISEDYRLPDDAEQGTQVSVQANEVEAIKLSFLQEEISLIVTNDTNVRIEQTSDWEIPQENQMRYIVKNGELIAISGFYNKPFRFKFYEKTIQTTLYIPQNLVANVELSTASGNINAEGGEYQKLVVSTASGTIEGKQLKADELYTETVSGDTVLKDFKSNMLKMDATSGRIQAQGNAAEWCSLDSMSGDVKFEGDTRSFKGSTVSGKLEAKLTGKTQEMRASSVSGDNEISFLNAQALNSIKSDTVSGSIRITLPENEGFTLLTSSVSGSVDNGFEMLKNQHGNGAIQIDLETVSGDIKIE